MEAGGSKEERGGVEIDEVPPEILQLMFFNLWEQEKDVPSLLISAFVCKKWNAAVNAAVLSRLSLNERRKYFRYGFARAVVKAGNFALLQWGRGCPIDESAFEAAGELGNKEILEWLLSNSKMTPRPSGNAIALGAGRGGHKEILQWLLGKVWSRGELPMLSTMAEEAHCYQATRGAAEGCQLDFLEWIFLEKKVNLSNAVATIVDLAAGRGHVKLFDWLDHRCIKTPQSEWKGWEIGYIPWSAGLLHASEFGHVVILDWIKRNFPQFFDPRLVVQGGSVKSLEWLLSQPDYDGDTVKGLVKENSFNAARAGSEYLEWAWQQWKFEALPPISDVLFLQCSMESNKLEMVQWALEKGYQPASSLLNSAIKFGARVSIFQELVDHGCHVDETQFPNWVGIAMATRRLDLLQWLATIRPIKWGVKLANKVVGKGNVEMIAWMVGEGCPIDASTFRLALRANDLVMCKWLKEHNCLIDLRTIKADSSKTYDYIQEWLKLICPDVFGT